MTSEYQGYRNGHTTPLNTCHYRQKTKKTKPRPPEQGLSNGLIILVIAIVVGCFAVLWPKYFYPMMFGDPQPHPKYDPETLFMEGPHGREYLRNRLKERGPGHPGVHPGTGHNRDSPPPPHTGPGRATPPIRAASDGPMPGMRPMPGVHPGGQGQPPSQEKGRGVMGYLMPIYTVAILILFVYTAMKLVFKKKPGSEEDEVEQRRVARRRQRQREQGEGARYDEEYYNNLISQEQQRQTQGSEVQEVADPSPVEPRETEPVKEDKQTPTPVVDTTVRTNHSSTTSETKRVDETMEDKKDVEILMLQARLDQTEQTLQKLIGQMGALTASLANAGLVVSPDSDQEEVTGGDSEAEDGHNINDEEDHGHQDESDSDDETEESEEDGSESE